MLTYPKSLPMPALTRKTKTFTVFTKSRKEKNPAASGSIPYEECLNFTCRGNGLVAEIGCEKAWNNPIVGYEDLTAMCVYTHPDKGKGVAFTIEDEVNFAYGDEGQEPLFWGEYTLTDPVMLAHSSISGAQYLFLGAKEGVYAYYNKSLRKVNNLPDCKAAVWCNERVFVLSYKYKNRLYYSLFCGENVPSYVATREYIDFETNEGEIEDMAVCSDMVYLLRQNKLTRLKTNGWDDDFVADDISCSFGAPIARSMRACGGKVVFACTDGLYILTNETLEKASLPFDFSDVTGNAYSGTFGRYYFLSYTGAEGVRTFFYSPDTEEYALTDFEVIAPAQDGEGCFFYRAGMLCALNSESVLCGKPLKKVWKSVATDFSLGTGRKLLRAITLRGKGKITLTVRSNSGMGGTYALDLSSGEGRADVLLKGEKFTVQIESADADCRIEGLDAEADVYANTYSDKEGSV